METVNVSRESWHYRLVDAFGGVGYGPYDICSYTRKLLGTLLILFAGLLFFSWLGLVAVTGLVGWVMALFHHSLLANNKVGPCMAADLIAAVVFTVIYGGGHLKAIIEDRLEERRRRPIKLGDGFVRTAWRHFKERTCVLIKFS